MLRLALPFHDASTSVRYDARTQLTVIRGYAQWGQRQLAVGSRDDRQRVQRALVAIEQASRRLEASLEQAAQESAWR